MGTCRWFYLKICLPIQNIKTPIKIVNTPQPHQSSGLGPKGPVFPLIQSIVVLVTQDKIRTAQTIKITHLHHILFFLLSIDLTYINLPRTRA